MKTYYLARVISLFFLSLWYSHDIEKNEVIPLPKRDFFNNFINDIKRYTLYNIYNILIDFHSKSVVYSN